MLVALNQYSLWIFGVFLAGILIGLLAAARYAREGRVSQFYFIREQAKVKAGRVMMLVGFLVVVTLALAMLLTASSTFTRVAQAKPTPTPTPTLSPTTPAVTVPTASPTPALPPTPKPTATASPSPTIISTPGTPSSALTPIAGVETPSPDATFGEITLAQGVTKDNEPKDPGTVFPAGISELYAFFDYQNLSDGVLWTQAWYRKGKEIGSESNLWEWGSYGTAWVFLKPVGGYSQGEYEIRLYIGDELKQTATFTVR
ncbi:MAG: hypothetical protein ACETWR_12530 [Anaerolineae bacterium]